MTTFDPRLWWNLKRQFFVPRTWTRILKVLRPLTRAQTLKLYKSRTQGIILSHHDHVHGRDRNVDRYFRQTLKNVQIFQTEKFLFAIWVLFLSSSRSLSVWIMYVSLYSVRSPNSDWNYWENAVNIGQHYFHNKDLSEEIWNFMAKFVMNRSYTNCSFRISGHTVNMLKIFSKL